MPGRGKRIGAASVLVGSAVLALAAFAGRERILEEYYLWKLDHLRGSQRADGEADKVIVRLGELRSLSAVPLILDHVRRHWSYGSVPCTKICVDALASAGARAVSQLVHEFEGERLDGREAVLSALSAILSLGRMGEAARPAIPSLLKKLQHPEADIREVIAVVLGLIGAPQISVQLKELLAGDEDERVRSGAALGLLQLGDPGEDALLDMLRTGGTTIVRTIAALEVVNSIEWNSSDEKWFRLRVRELSPALKRALAEAQAAQEREGYHDRH